MGTQTTVMRILLAILILLALATVTVSARSAEARSGEQYFDASNSTVVDDSMDPAAVWERNVAAERRKVDELKAANVALQAKINDQAKLEASLSKQVATQDAGIADLTTKIATLLTDKTSFKAQINSSDDSLAQSAARLAALEPVVEKNEEEVAALGAEKVRVNASYATAAEALNRAEEKLLALGVKPNLTKAKKNATEEPELTKEQQLELEVKHAEAQLKASQAALHQAELDSNNTNSKVFSDERPPLVQHAETQADAGNVSEDGAARILLTGFGQPKGMLPSEFAADHSREINKTRERERYFNQYPYVPENKRAAFLDECVQQLGNDTEAITFCREDVTEPREHATDTYEMVKEEKAAESVARMNTSAANASANASANEHINDTTVAEVARESSNTSSNVSTFNGSSSNGSGVPTSNATSISNVAVPATPAKPKISAAKAAAIARVANLTSKVDAEQSALRRLRAALSEEYRNHSMDCLSCALKALGHAGRNQSKAFQQLKKKFTKAGSDEEKSKLASSLKASINSTFADDANRTRLSKLVDRAANMSTADAQKAKEERAANKTNGPMKLVPAAHKRLISNITRRQRNNTEDENVNSSAEQSEANDIGSALSEASPVEAAAMVNALMGKKMPAKSELQKLSEAIFADQQELRLAKNDSGAAESIANNATNTIKSIISELQDRDTNAALKPNERQGKLQALITHISELGSGNMSNTSGPATDVADDNIGPVAKVKRLLNILNSSHEGGKSAYEKRIEVEGAKNNATVDEAESAEAEIAGTLDKKKEEEVAGKAADRINEAPKGPMVALVRKMAGQKPRPQVNVTKYAVHLLNSLNNNDTNASSCNGRRARELILKISQMGKEANQTHLDALTAVLTKVATPRHDVGLEEESARNQTAQNIQDIAWHLSRGETQIAAKEDVLKGSIAPQLSSVKQRNASSALAAVMRKAQENATKKQSELEKANTEFAATNTDPHGELTSREDQEIKEEKLAQMAGSSLASGELSKQQARELISKLTGQPVKKDAVPRKKRNATEYAIALTHRLAETGNTSAEYAQAESETVSLVWNLTTGQQGRNASLGMEVNSTQRTRLAQLLHALSTGGNRSASNYDVFGPKYTKAGAQRSRNIAAEAVLDAVDTNLGEPEDADNSAVPAAGRRTQLKPDDVKEMEAKETKIKEEKEAKGDLPIRIPKKALEKNETADSNSMLQKAKRANDRSARNNANASEEDEAAEDLAEHMKNGDKEHLRGFMRALREGKQGMNATNRSATNTTADCNTKKLQQQGQGLEYEMSLLKEKMKQREEMDAVEKKNLSFATKEDKEELMQLQERKKKWEKAAAEAGSERRSWRISNVDITSCWSVCSVQFFEDMECTKQVSGGRPIESGHRDGHAAPAAFRNSVCGVGGNSYKPSGAEGMWSPVGSKGDALGTEKAWLGMEFSEPRNIRCVKIAQHPHRDQQVDSVYVQSYDESGKVWKTAFIAKDIVTDGDFVSKSLVNSR